MSYIHDWISSASADNDGRTQVMQRENEKVRSSSKLSVSGFLIAAAFALSGCSNAPTTLSGLASPAKAVEVAPNVDPKKALFAFEPFDGVPVNIGDNLTQRLMANASTYEINIIPRLQDDATYRVRGHIEATSDNTATIISYIYDVFDSNGARVHQINGQEIAGASLGDPWSPVADGAIDQIAIRSLIEIRNWLYSRQ